MFARSVSLAAISLFLGCATAPAPEEPKQEEQGYTVVPPKKKKKKCKKQLVTGSRLPQMVCAGDPEPQNLMNMTPEQLRELQRRGSPTSN